jgi:aprataxin and PNK-like factor
VAIGNYGAGIYLSPRASTSLSYARGSGKLLVCAVLMGRIFECTGLMHGAPCVDGTLVLSRRDRRQWLTVTPLHRLRQPHVA